MSVPTTLYSRPTGSRSLLNNQVIYLAPKERKKVLAKFCNGDTKLRHEVETLIKAEEENHGQLAEAVESAALEKMETRQSIITLSTDFGTIDYFVGTMKGAILSINPGAKIIDITHEIPPQDISSASFTLRACYRNFPKKTIFVAVVDPGVGSNRKAILVETEDYYFIAPDNGLLSFIFDEATDFRVYELTNEKFFKHPISHTFHGRDIFAPVAAHLSNSFKANVFGNETQNFVRLEENKPRKVSEKEVEAEIIHIDRFGNLITNLAQKDLPENFTLEINGTKIEKMQSFFAEAEKGELFMILGSAGFLEVVAFQDSAVNILSAKTGQKITVTVLA